MQRTTDIGNHLLTIDEVADLLRTTPNHVRKLCYESAPERRLPRVKIGRLVRFRPIDIQTWVDNNVIGSTDTDWRNDF